MFHCHLDGMVFGHFINFLRTMYHIKVRFVIIKITIIEDDTFNAADAFDLNLSLYKRHNFFYSICWMISYEFLVRVEIEILCFNLIK